MAAFVNFTSTRVIDKQKQAVREARQSVLEKAKRKHDQLEKRAQEAKLRGEDTWMLSSVDKRIKTEEQEYEKAKQRHKKEKKKKKKHKKHKKKNDVSTGSDSDSGSEPQWVEKTSKSDDKQSEKATEPVIGPTLQRESWMECPFDILPTECRKESRQEQRKKKEMEKRAEAEKLGQHERELNPYWKDGGTGLPEEQIKPSSKPVAGIGDGGLSWLRKSYERCKQQAADEGRSLEDVAADRFGSLKKLEKMIHEAEKFGRESKRKPYNREERPRMSGSHQNRDNRSRTYQDNRRSWSPDDWSPRDNSRKKQFMKPEHSDNYLNDTSRDSRERERHFIKPDDSRHERSRSSSSSQRRFVKPGDISESSSSSGSRSDHSGQRRFAKPGEMAAKSLGSRSEYSRSRSDHSSEPRWKKQGFRKPVDESKDDRQEKRNTESRESVRQRSRSHHRSRSKSPSPSPSPPSSSSSSSSDSSDDNVDDVEDVPVQKKPVVLSEKEMNELGAKILRAEIMGDESLAQELKTKLEEARKVAASQPASTPAQSSTPQQETEEVVLTRTGKGGVVVPLPESQHVPDRYGRKRRKKEKVPTHESGQRVRYFDDDDKFSLKSLVEQEKMGTAEDQNSMFARLAGRISEKTDEDYQMDDVMLTKAVCKQSDSHIEERNRAKAIFEHKKMSGAMDKCHYCFNKVPKHLIIAIGIKVYLCLPNYRSLTNGHCLIVPMQHVLSGTSVDEDVWQEIQTFRKTLVTMFESRDLDVVFMETSMHLKKFPHMTIECVPLEKETGDLAPIYFKKAILDSGSEWAQNKKLVDISKKDIRHAVPKGFPYFSVDFGRQGGFAHVIEDEVKFPSYFGKEIIGGMVDAEPNLWRKPHRESFDEQRRKVLEFAEWWKPFDWTQNLQSGE